MPGKRITDHQVHKYKQHRNKLSQVAAAAKSAISERSARRIDHGSDALPSQRPERSWRTRDDPLAAVWDSEVVPLLQTDARLNAVTLLEELQRRHPGEHGIDVLRTLQRRLAPVARCPRRRARGLLRAGTPAGATRPVRLHRRRRTGHRDRRRRLRAPAVPVRARPFGLAPCDGRRRRRELHRPVHGAAGRAVVPGRCARGAPHRQPVGGVQQPRRGRGADPALRRPVPPLRRARQPLQPWHVQRERINRIAPRLAQDRARPGAAPAGVALLRPAQRLRGVRRTDRATLQRARGQALGRRTRDAQALADAAHRRIRRAAGTGEQVRRLHRPRACSTALRVSSSATA